MRSIFSVSPRLFENVECVSHCRNVVVLRFGFVEYKSEETCKAVKDAMADSEIDGSKVTIDYAQARVRRRRLGMQPA